MTDRVAADPFSVSWVVAAAEGPIYRIHRRQDHIQTEINQVYVGDRNSYVTGNDEASIENVVQRLEQRELVMIEDF